MRQILLALLILFAINPSFADETASSPNEQLQEIIDLFLDDSDQDAFAELELHESDLIISTRASKSAETYMLLGRTYFYAEMDGKAINAFKAALQLDSSLAKAHFYSGLIHRYADDLDRAEKSFRDAIAANSNNEDYFVELGRTLEKKNDPTAAAIAYKNALALDSKIFPANFGLAAIYANEGDTDGAKKHFLLAIEQEPDDLDSHYNLGQLYQNNQQHHLAIKQFEKVVALNPNEWQAIAKLVQENEAINDYPARDLAIENIYEVWRTDADEYLREQGFYIREQSELENGKLFVLEYFELKGERPRKFVFKLQDEQTGEAKFDVSLGSYEQTTNFSRSLGRIGPDQRIYHIDGYSPNGSHYTYGFSDSVPTYEAVKEIALKALAGEHEVISSTVPTSENAQPEE